MPLLKIATNRDLDEAAAAHLARDASRAVAEMLGKPERYVMVDVAGGRVMTFAGTDEPLAYLELKSIGLPAERTAEFSAALCEMICTRLRVPKDRIYIEFADAERHMWGWNGGTF